MPTPSIKETISAHDEGEDLPRMGAASIEAAAKAISACMDYPWEHMPEQGRNTMRRNAKTVLAAATSAAPQSDGSALALLAHAPKFPECETAEPTLRSLIHRYYQAHFADRLQAIEYANQYIDSLLAVAPTQGQNHGQ